MTVWKKSSLGIEALMGDRDKVLSSLGLCVKAGKVIFGVPMICEAMKKGGKSMPVAVLEASDVSDNTHKRIGDRCAYYGVRIIKLECGGEELAAALGKSAFLGAVAVTDEKMLSIVEKHINTQND